MKMLWATIQVLFVLLVLLRPALAGEVYTWTDEEGNIHITDRPPQDSTQVESVIRYSNRPETKAPSDPELQKNKIVTQKVAQLNKKLKRLKERKMQLETILAENQAGIDTAEKDATYYSKRRGSYGRRNQKAIEQQLVLMNSNLTTYQSDLRYVEEDIAEIQRLLEAIELNVERTEGQSGAPTPTN